MGDRHPLKRRADAAFKARRFQEAIDLYAQLLEEDPAQLVCLLNIGAAHLERREWEKARETCEKFVRQTEEAGGAADPLLAKAHYRMALACLELGLKDATVFGPAIYYRNALRDAERAWAQAAGSAILRQPVSALFSRLRDTLRKQQQQQQQQALAGQPQTGMSAVAQLVRPPQEIQGAPAPTDAEELLVWGLVWLRGLLRVLHAEEARVARTADVVQLLERGALSQPEVMLRIVSQGTEECGLFRQQLEVVLSLRACHWPEAAQRTFARANWLLPAHCIARFTVPLRLSAPPLARDVRLTALLLHDGAVPLLGAADGSPIPPGDPRALKDWILGQPAGQVSLFDNVAITDGPNPTLEIDLPRLEVVTGCPSTLWLLDLTTTTLVAAPIGLAFLQEPGRQRWQ